MKRRQDDRMHRLHVDVALKVEAHYQHKHQQNNINIYVLKVYSTKFARQWNRHNRSCLVWMIHFGYNSILVVGGPDVWLNFHGRKTLITTIKTISLIHVRKQMFIGNYSLFVTFSIKISNSDSNAFYSNLCFPLV